jgi:hypothetical protein
LWAGLAETWEPTSAEYGRDLITTLKCSDQFKALRYRDLNQTFPAQLSGDRIVAALQGPKGYGLLVSSAGIIVSTPVTYVAADPVDAAQRAAATEQGFLYCDESGRVRYDDRNYRVVNELSTRITFGDGAGEMPYADPVYNYNDEHLFTEVRIKPGDAVTEQSVPAGGTSANISQYGRRTLALTLPTQNSLVDDTANAAWALTLANVLLNKYQDPGVRLDEITVNPYANAALWPGVLSAPLGGRFTVRQRPAYLVASGASQTTSATNSTTTTKTTGLAGMIERPTFVEQISMSIKPGAGRWLVKYGLSDANSLSYWILGDTNYSVLGSTTRLGV